MNRITMYLFESIVRFITSLPTAIVIYLPILAILFISKKRTHIHIFRCCLEVIFIMYIITIFKITGIIGTQFHVEWFTDSIQHFEFSIPFVGGSPIRQKRLLSAFN